MKKYLKYILISAGFVLCGVLYCCGDKDDGAIVLQTQENTVTAAPTGEEALGLFVEPQESEKISVYICGGVVTPGVFELSVGARIADALELAGGFSEDAVRESINLAAYIADGEMIYIPREGEEIPVQADASDGMIDINAATKDELMTLPGIGSAKADAIIKYRETAAFSSVEDIMKVQGIKEGAFEKIKDFIVVR